MKKLPLWLKIGIILGLSASILFTALGFFSDYFRIPILGIPSIPQGIIILMIFGLHFCIGSPSYICPPPENNILLDLTKYLVVGFVLYFFIGAMIGWIYEKIKN